MKNFEKLAYTYNHRKILYYLAEKYYNNPELLERLKSHDMDKLFMLLFYEKKDIEKVHRSLASHHDNDIPKDKLDYIEMVLDWESARYTKEDKPFNAYDTLYKFYPHLESEILPILEELNINKSTLEKEEDVVDYFNSLPEVTEKSLKLELTNYIKHI